MSGVASNEWINLCLVPHSVLVPTFLFILNISDIKEEEIQTHDIGCKDKIITLTSLSYKHLCSANVSLGDMLLFNPCDVSSVWGMAVILNGLLFWVWILIAKLRVKEPGLDGPLA